MKYIPSIEDSSSHVSSLKKVIINRKQGHITNHENTSIVIAYQHRLYSAFSFKEKNYKFIYIFIVSDSVYVYVQLLLSRKDLDMMEKGRRLHTLYTIPSHMAQNMYFTKKNLARCVPFLFSFSKSMLVFEAPVACVQVLLKRILS